MIDPAHDVDPTQVIARIQASPIRRVFAVGMQGILGCLLLYLAFNEDLAGFGYRLFLIVGGALSLWSAQRLWRATSVALELTSLELRNTDGKVLALCENMTKVDRGLFAFKPSNGFMIHLDQKHPRAWLPGMWWCTGKRLGVGGVIPSGEAKFMAETVQMMIALRDQ
jgi:hypothetical protein